MSTMEYMFMQIFDRKREIEDRFKHQVESYGENLASNLLAEGQCPPPWLLNSSSLCPNPKELNREQLISEILELHPRVTTPANNNNFYVVPNSEKIKVNLFSNSIFPEQCALTNNCGVKTSNEVVSQDVPEDNQHNSETGVEDEVTDKQLSQTSMSRHKDSNSRPSKKAKIANNLVEENNVHELVGRVTRSMPTCLKNDHVKDNGKVSRSRSQGQNYLFIDQASLLTNSQENVNHVLNGSVANKHCFQAAYTKDNGQIANSLSSRLSAITLLAEPKLAKTVISNTKDSPVSKFDQENSENAIEEINVNSAKVSVEELLKMPKPSIQLPCQSYKTTPVSDSVLEECFVNSKEVLSDNGYTKKSKGSSVIERKECYTSDNVVDDPDVTNIISDDGKDERSTIIETETHMLGSYANVSLPSRILFQENVYDSSPDIGKMLSSSRDLSVQPIIMQDSFKECSEGEKSTGQPGNEMNEVYTRLEKADCSAEEETQRSDSLCILSQDDLQSPIMMLEGKRESEEMGTVEDRMMADSKENIKALQKRYFLRSLSSNDRHYATSKLSGVDNSCNLKRSIDRGCDNTWPKRKKNRNQSTNILATSPRLRAESHKDNEQVDCICSKSLDYNSGSSIDFQPSMLSHNVEVELSEAALGSHFEEEILSEKHRIMEGDQEMTGKYHAVDEELRLNLGGEHSSVITEPSVLNLGRCSLDKVENKSQTKLGKYENLTVEGQMHGGEEYSHSAHDSAKLSERRENVAVNLDQILPEFEGFTINIAPILEEGVIYSNTEISSLSKERASLLEQLCKSGSMLTMESCPSSNYNINSIPDMYQSLPADILEQMNVSNSFNINGSDEDQAMTNKDGKVIGKLPLTPPVEKLQRRMTLKKSFASGDELGSNPELVCFRIDENSISSEQEPTSEQMVGSSEVHMSTNINALSDVTSKYQNIMPTPDSASGKCLERTLDSVKSKPRLVADFKENFNLVGKLSNIRSSANSVGRKSEKSAKTTDRNVVRISSELRSMPNNIVSNISSFIPLVKEKQQTTAHGLGKREIKVKALEVAEAAKRLEEKRQHEREMKKAAAKLERVRLEQENYRRLELKQKQKEELKKKKEEDIKARKRQREAERIAKERKRRCTEEARKQRSVHDEKLRDKNANGKKRKGKELSKEVKKLARAEKGKEATCTVTIEAVSSISRVDFEDLTHAIGASFKANDSYKAVNASSHDMHYAIQDRMSVTAESRDMNSYEISPYKDSDDEEGDGGHNRKGKFVPSWARKELLNQILLNGHLNPTEIFSRKGSFDLIKALVPQVNRRPLS